MKYLDRPQHVAAVQRRIATPSDYGSIYADDGAPVLVPCTIRALSAEESEALGVTATTVYRLICRSWPGDINSLITWNGALYEPIGDPLRFDGSARTAHFEVRLKRIQQGRG